MKAWKTILGGFLLVALTLLIVVSAMSLAAAESAARTHLVPTATETLAMVWIPATPEGLKPIVETEAVSPTSTSSQENRSPSSTPTAMAIVSSTYTPVFPIQPAQDSPLVTKQADASSTAVASATPTSIVLPPVVDASPTFCSPPAGWVPYTIQPGDTLQSLSFWSATPTDEIRRLNCLSEDTLHIGAFLFLPWLPSTPTVRSASQPATTTWNAGYGNTPGWMNYLIKPGDTLYSISRWSGASVPDLQAANHMGSSTALRAGATLLVPAGKSPPVTTFPEAPPSPQLPQPARLNIPVPILPPGQAILVPIAIPVPVGNWIHGTPQNLADPNNSAWLAFQPIQVVIYSQPFPPIQGIPRPWPW